MCLFKCPTTTNDATEFPAFGEIPSISTPGVKEMCRTLQRKITFLIMMSPLGACCGYCFSYYRGSVLKIPQILQHIPTWPTRDVFAVPATKFYHT